MNPNVLTASRYAMGSASKKRLWSDTYKAPQRDQDLDFELSDSNITMQHALRRYPGAVPAPRINYNAVDTDGTAELRRQLAGGITMHGVSFTAGPCSASIDILAPSGQGGVHLIDVVAACNVTDLAKTKAHYANKLAFNTWVVEQAGLQVDGQFVLHLNNEFIKDGDIDPHALMKLTDFSPGARAASREVQDKSQKLLAVLADSAHVPHEPEVFCADTDAEGLPERHVFTLTRGAKKACALREMGHLDLRQIPPTFALSPTQTIQVETEVSGKPHIDREKLDMFFSKLQYPLQFLDFETLATAVPVYDRSKPYAQIPFQFSLDIVDYPGGAVEHHEFLAEGKGDPRPALLTALQAGLRRNGTVVCYNSAFEKGRLKELAEHFPDHRHWIEAAVERTEDLYQPFRSFAYYHPDQKGKTTIKDVIQAISGQGYQDLTIGDGQTASREFMRITFGEVTDTERAQVRRNLLQYCGADTATMVATHEFLVNALDDLQRGGKGAPMIRSLPLLPLAAVGADKADGFFTF